MTSDKSRILESASDISWNCRFLPCPDLKSGSFRQLGDSVIFCVAIVGSLLDSAGKLFLVGCLRNQPVHLLHHVANLFQRKRLLFIGVSPAKLSKHC